MKIKFTNRSANALNDQIEKHASQHNAVPISIEHVGTVLNKFYSVVVIFKELR